MGDWHLTSKLTFSIGQRSIAGIKPQNEDAIGIRIPDGLLLSTKGAVAIIADGVSAAEAGKEASEASVTSFLSDYYSTPDTWSVQKSTSQVLTALNRWLYRKGSHITDAAKGYVTTLSCIVFKSHQAFIFHIGDSRIYRLRNGDFEQLTRDHATVLSKGNSYLTRAMGLDVKLDVDCQHIDIALDDIFFLCTDGVYDFITDKNLQETIEKKSDSYDDICERIVQLSLENGSDDNISCQLLKIDSLPSQSREDIHKKLTELPFPPELNKGGVLDGYRIEKELQATSRSQLYLVTDVETNQRYCMKTPSVNFEDDIGYIEQFIMESWVGSRIKQTNVVKIIETNKVRSCLYYLMEYIDGITLEQWIKENPKPPIQDVMYIIEQIFFGLRAFHRKETLHQDIKPGNIMIDKDGQVKIVDFGSCLVKGVQEISHPIQQHNILGTASYSAPETVLSAKSTEQSDIFSLAVITFEMLTGKAPFEGKLEHCRTAKAYLATKYIPAFVINPLIPYWIDAAVKKGLRFDPDRRHADISEFLHELKHANPKYKKHYDQALMEQNPLLFWQATSATLFIFLCISIYLHLGA